MPWWWRRKRALDEHADDGAPQRATGASAGPGVGGAPEAVGVPAASAGSARPPEPARAGSPGSESGAGAAEGSAGSETSAVSEAGSASAPSPARPEAGSTTALASVADRVGAILEAAEATATAIRREAEADAARAAAERRRRQQAREEVTHLGRLADSLSVQAEALSRQCQLVARVLLGPESGGGAAPAPTTAAPAREPAGPPGDERTPPSDESNDHPTHEPADAGADAPVRTSAAERGGDDAGGHANPAAVEPAPPEPPNGPVVTRLPVEWMEAYRMRLSGADRAEIEAYLQDRQVDDPGRILTEVFREAPEQR